jgi:hypothetical protein
MTIEGVSVRVATPATLYRMKKDTPSGRWTERTPRRCG